MTAIRRKTRRKPGWYLILTMILVIGGYGFIKSGQGIYKVWGLSRLLREEKRTLQENMIRKQNLEREIARLISDSTYIEEIARREYGMIKKGEEVLQISLPGSETKGGK